MSVFISWSGSGSKSHKIALLLRDWLPKVIQRLECFLSSKDIDAGAVWFDTLRLNLEKSKIGILCLTPDSIQKPWILFEAGFVARAFDQRRVYPLLVDIQTSDIPAPLSIFQAGTLAKADMLKMVHMVNDVSETTSLDFSTLEDSFELRWASFEKELKSILQTKESPAKQPPSNPDSAAIEEILKLVRGVASGSIPVAQRFTSPISSPVSEAVSFQEEATAIIGTPEAKQVFERLRRMVQERRPLALSWFDPVSKVLLKDNVLYLAFPPSERFSHESLSRPAQLSFLNGCIKELGFDSLSLRITPTTN